MSDIKKLTRIDFCNLENADAAYVSDTKYFTSGNGFTAHKHAGDYLENLTVIPYLGWNGEVYPQFKLENVFLEPIE